MISRVFASKFQQIHMIFVSEHCNAFMSKICQTVAGISRFSEFFFDLIFGGFFAILNLCGVTTQSLIVVVVIVIQSWNQMPDQLL